jgi:Tn3 transposase DDE domain
MTEWHARYGGPGVMVYWHVEPKQLCISSQLTTCSASDVAAMLQGLLHHDTDPEIETNITATTVSTINSHPWWTDKRGPVIPSARVAVVGSSRRGFRPRRGAPTIHQRSSTEMTEKLANKPNSSRKPNARPRRAHSRRNLQGALTSST